MVFRLVFGRQINIEQILMARSEKLENVSMFHNKFSNWEKNIFQGRGSLNNSFPETFSSVRLFITGEILPFLMLIGRTIFFILIGHI